MSGSEQFNPYSKWLAIPPEDQPPNHYRLLGIRQLESDPEVIDAAVEQRTGFLRKHQSGPHGAAASRLLNEIAAARLCLLNLGKKAAYDRQLQPTPLALDTSRTSATVGRAVPLTGIVVTLLGMVGLGLVGWFAFKPQPVSNSNFNSAKRTKSSSKQNNNVASTNKAEQQSATDSVGNRSTRQSARPDKSASNQVAQVSPKEASAGGAFRAPQGSLVEADKPASEKSSATAPAEASVKTAEAKPTDTNKKPANEAPVPPDVSDARLLAAMSLLDKAESVATTKAFKKLKTALAECKEPPKKQKAHSPALLVELDKLLAKCDENEFPAIRVQGTKSFNGHDYAYVNVDYSWNTARELCEAMGGHLATLNSAEEAAFVESSFLRPTNKLAWLGGHDQPKEGEWRWVTGEPWSFAAWINNDYGAGHALTWSSDAGFNDWMGDQRYAYVCEWESNASPELIALGSDTRIFAALWEAHIQARLDRLEQRQKRFKMVHQAAQRLEREGHADQARVLYLQFKFEAPPARRFANRKSEYCMFRDAKTWHEAEAHCERMGGHLVIINDPVEATEVLKHAVQNEISVFIGCTDEYKEGQWRWVTGQPVKLRMILNNFHGHEHVGIIEVKDKRATLEDGTASSRNAYICEWELD